MYYLDTSFIIASLTAGEVSSLQARKWLTEYSTADLVISRWVDAEVSSASSIKVRTGALTISQRADMLQQWHCFRDDSTLMAEVVAEDFQVAGKFALQHELSLRASDALHISVALRQRCTLATFDTRMAEAAVLLGVPVADTNIAV